MSKIKIDGNPIETIGDLPKVNSAAPDFKLVAEDLSKKTLEDFKGEKVLLNIFPSVGTGVCAASIREFNKGASSIGKVLCISKDLPFAQKAFCAAEGIENVIMLSDFIDGSFGKDYGLVMTSGIFDGLLSRCVVIVNKDGIITYTEQVPDIGEEPNYEAALKAFTNS